MNENLVRETVYLTEAFRWICPKCKHINYNAAVADELTDNGIRDILDLNPDHEITDEIREVMMSSSAPANVKCRACAERFKAIDSLYADDEGDSDFEEC